MNPTISVIMPVYNANDRVVFSIQSVLCQTFSDFELIVVDDGSTDNSVDVIKRMMESDNRIRLINKKNEGVSVARNTGIINSCGQYICFIDSDDQFRTDYLEKMLREIEKTNSDVVICGYEEKPSNRIVSLESQVLTVNELSMIFDKVYSSNCLNIPWNKLYKRDKVIEYFPKDISIGEDLIFNLKNIANLDRVSIIGDPLYIYFNDNPGSLSGKYHVNAFESIEMMHNEINKFVGDEWVIEHKHIVANWEFDDLWRCISRLCRNTDLSYKVKKKIYSGWKKTDIFKNVIKNINKVKQKRKLFLLVPYYFIYSFANKL